MACSISLYTFHGSHHGGRVVVHRRVAVEADLGF